MEISAQVFWWLSATVGAIALFASVLCGLGWAVVEVYKQLGIWHVICLAISIRLHGKDYADRQFWWAVQERASKSRFDAKLISDFALKHAPEGGSDEI